jgi:acetyl-CoA C-acetyltransferase
VTVPIDVTVPTDVNVPIDVTVPTDVNVPIDVTVPIDPLTPVVVAARRTPVTGAGRGLAEIEAAELAAAVLAPLQDELTALLAGVPAAPTVDDVLLGNCCGPGGDVARSAVLAAGLGVSVPAVTVDRQCGSGLEALRLAAGLVRSGEATVVLAGGVESASTAPLRFARAQTEPYLRAPFAPAGFADPEMGEAADTLARVRGIDRERQDAYAARSHARAVAAARDGRYADELVPLAGVSADDRPRAGLTEATLARFRPAFGPDGTATAGNSCGINDGAAVLAVIPEQVRARAGLPGLAVLGTAVAGVDPALPGLGPVPAVQAVLRRAQLTIDDVEVLELTEAFAAQVLACTDALGLDPLGADAERVCPQGGAIALGHPWGASGAMLVVRLFSVLVREPAPARSPRSGNRRLGVATCAIGGGQGIAVLMERVG